MISENRHIFTASCLSGYNNVGTSLRHLLTIF